MLSIKKTKSERVFTVFNTVLMCLIVVVTLYPLWYILCASLSSAEKLISFRGLLFAPLGWNTTAYSKVMTNPDVGNGYINTLFVVIIGTAFNLVMTTLGAFVLTRKDFLIKRAMSLMIVFTMYFQGGLIPTFLVVQGVGLVDSRWSLILPIAINTFNLIIMRTNFAAFPAELEDATRVDGANDIVLLFRIMIPICAPVFAVMALFYATSHWNSWLSSVLYLRTRSAYPLQLILREILIANDMNAMKEGIDLMDNLAVAATIKYATIIVSTLPILCIYPFIQRYFVKGVMVGAIKG